MPEPLTATPDAPPASPAPPPVETPSGPRPDETSIAAHEASLAPPADDGADPKARRHHRRKDIATPADVPRIAELTKKFRTAEQEASEWRRKYEEAQAAPRPVAPETARTVTLDPPRAAVVVEPTAPAGEFTFPAFDAWVATHPDKSWDDWNRAQYSAYYDYRETQREAAANARQSESAALQRQQALRESAAKRVEAFRATHPDYDARIKSSGDAYIPPVFYTALLMHDKMPHMLYTLSERPDLLAEMHLIGDGKQVSDAAVASAQRWLDSRLQTAITGSVAAAVKNPAVPRPPNPVRTGPVTPSDEPPGDSASLAAHERFYGQPKRRR